jgi:LysR family glycine cleavage system transcriptional activator
MAIDAAIEGQGVALARSALAAWDLLAGRLVRLPFGPPLPMPYAYWIVCPRATANLPKITAFRNWLVGEAEEDARRLDARGLLG